MAYVQSKQQNVQKRTVKKASQTAKKKYCILCRKTYLKNEAHDHMHSMQHHNELDALFGKDAFHHCQACKMTPLCLKDYADHICTSRHKIMFKRLKTKNVKSVSLFEGLGSHDINRILIRNKALKKEEKKAIKKKKKKEKQKAQEKHANKQQARVQNRNLDSKKKAPNRSKQMQARAPNQLKQTPHPGNNHSVVQNKENNIYQMQNPPAPPPPCRPFPYQNWRPPYHPRVPVGQPHPYQHIRWHNESYGNNQHHQMEANRFQMSSHNSQRTPSNLEQAMPAVSQSSSTQQNPACHVYFTSDELPQSGAIVFDHNQAEKVDPALPNSGETDSNQPGAVRNRSAPGDSENKSSSPAPIRDVDISAMLKQIRRALGVREPCRADREARRQKENVQSDNRDAEKQDNPEQMSATPANTGPLNSTSAPLTDAGVSSSTIPPLKEKLSTFKATHETNQTKSQKLKDCPNNDEKGKFQEASNALPSVSGCTVDRKPVNKWLHLPGVGSKSSWTEMYDHMKKKNLKGRPRFGIQLGVQPTNNEGPAQDDDLPLSEGFHWESIPEGSSVPPPALLSSHADHLSEPQSDSNTQDSSEQPDVAQPGCSSKTAEQISVKVEPNLEKEILSSKSNANKRPRSMLAEDGVSLKKKKRKSKRDSPGQTQMDQLLAVSLKEDELSHSLQDLDKALIQARNALQAAYAEVQRLLLLKQQFTAEVNSLRAKRIEILQGMQEGYIRGSPAEGASTFSPGAAGSSLLLPTSLSQTQFAATFIPPAYPAGLVLPAVSLKQEVIRSVEAGQPSQPFLRTTEGSTSTDAPLPESSARDGLKSVKMELLEKEMQPSDFVEGTEENVRTEQDEGNEPSGDKVAKKREKKKTSGVEDEGSESDSSVEVVDPSNQEVIDIEELECEDPSETDATEQPEDPQTSATVDVRFASTQTSQECETESKFKAAVHSKNDANQPAEFMAEDEPSLGTFSSHAGPVNGLQIHEGRLYTCSGDNTARAYSLVSRECEAVFEGHTNKVNCLLVSSLPNMPTRLYTGSSDQTIRCYSIKSNKCLEQISLPDRVLCLHIAWKILFVGLASGSVISHDLKTLKELDALECHGPRGVSCLGTAQEGARRLLLVGSYDSTISVRDAKSGLLLRTLEGHTKTVLCIKVINDLVFSGSSDTSVHAHNIHTGELVRIYKGHGHAVTSIVILGKVMVTACLDKLVRVYELQSHDRLQVYGGHSDMVMCMAVHKSVIYTGCYDGSVQAVKLNLMKNYRCWWQGCALIFGIAEHLFQHLVRDHSNPNLQTIKCRWKECSRFFSTQQAVRQELPEHMQSHIDSDGKLLP